MLRLVVIVRAVVGAPVVARVVPLGRSGLLVSFLALGLFAVVVRGAGAHPSRVQVERTVRFVDATPVPMTYPLPPPDQRPPGWIAIEKVSNGCGGGGASTEPGLQNWLGDSAIFGSLNPFEPKFRVNFREACNLHDAAYSGAYVWDSINNKFTDFRGMTRKEADDKLQRDMDKLCEARIPARWTTAVENCKAGVGHWIIVRVIGIFIYRARIDLTGKWENPNPGWPLCDTGVGLWTITQTGRTVIADWQHGTSGGSYGHFEGVFVTGDLLGDDRVTGTFTVTDGKGGPKVSAGPMTWTVTSGDKFDFNGGAAGGTMARTTQGVHSLFAFHRCRLPRTKPVGTSTQPTAPTQTGALRLTITLQGATETRDLKTNAPTPAVGSPGATAHLQSGQSYGGTVTLTGVLPAGYSVYVEFQGRVWAVLGPTGGDFSGITETKGFGAANDVGAFACKTGASKGDALPSACLAEGADIAVYWNP